MPGPLEQIAARNPDPAREQARDRAAAEFRKQMRDQAALATARVGAMRFCKPIIGRVIFPARWSARAGADRTYGAHVRCWTRWQGLRLVVFYYGPNDHGWPTALLTVEGPGEGQKAKVQTQAELAAALREWGLV